MTISWTLMPNSKRRETLVYDLAITDYDDVTQLGASSPFVQMAEQLKKLREDWQYIAKGSRKVSVNSFTRADREAERAAVDARYGRGIQPEASPAVEPTKPPPRKRSPKRALPRPDKP